MPIEFQEVKGNIVNVRVTGRLSDDDYKIFVPRMESLIQQWGRLRMLFEMVDDFQGWDLSSAWQEFKFQAKHMKDVKRVAVVGNKKWEQWATAISRMFTGTDVRYFDESAVSEARDWISTGW